MTTTLVFYDGVCGLCDRFVQFLLRRDRGARFKFAPLQGELASRVLPARGRDPSQLDTVYVVTDLGSADSRVLERSAAVLYAMGQLGGVWRVAARLAAAVPRPISDAVYRFVARVRYRVFGRYDACPLPRPEWRSRFIDS